MSQKNSFKISVNQLFVHSGLILAGITLASIFVYFSPQELQTQFFEKFESYFNFSGLSSSVALILLECFWILLIGVLTYIPYGRVANILILLYKGFSIGVVSSIACKQLAFSGIKYIFFLIFPPNFFYIMSLCIATQISFEITAGQLGRHSKDIPVDKTAYIVSILLALLGGLIETYYVPWMYKILF